VNALDVEKIKNAHEQSFDVEANNFKRKELNEST